MPRGGSRRGTPGKAYANRTDLQTNMAPDTTGSVARGGMPLPQPQMQPPAIGAEEVPDLADPTMRPSEPVTAGLSLGAGAGPEALGVMPPLPSDPVRLAVEGMILASPNPDLMRVLSMLKAEGR